MIEEPFRWVEAIQNRREYIEHQLAVGSPIACLSCPAGVLLLTVSRERQKIFEIYDRIAMGGIGHPGDIERLRMAAIEVTSAEGFGRSAQDVSLRRLASYSLSPLLKAAFEQIYGPPYLSRMLFVELGRRDEPDLFVRLDYDGAFHTNGGSFSKAVEPFAVISGKTHSSDMMEKFLRGKDFKKASLDQAFAIALDAWMVGHIALSDDAEILPSEEALAAHREEQLGFGSVEAALLDREARTNITYRSLTPSEVGALVPV
ncbi:MAG: proteasome subunit alpha [Verrucomicrobiota bacterium]